MSQQNKNLPKHHQPVVMPKQSPRNPALGPWLHSLIQTRKETGHRLPNFAWPFSWLPKVCHQISRGSWRRKRRNRWPDLSSKNDQKNMISPFVRVQWQLKVQLFLFKAMSNTLLILKFRKLNEKTSIFRNLDAPIHHDLEDWNPTVDGKWEICA